MNKISTVSYHIFARISADFDILFWLIVVSAAAADSRPNDDTMKVRLNCERKRSLVDINNRLHYHSI